MTLNVLYMYYYSWHILKHIFKYKRIRYYCYFNGSIVYCCIILYHLKIVGIFSCLYKDCKYFNNIEENNH